MDGGRFGLRSISNEYLEPHSHPCVASGRPISVKICDLERMQFLSQRHNRHPLSLAYRSPPHTPQFFLPFVQIPYGCGREKWKRALAFASSLPAKLTDSSGIVHGGFNILHVGQLGERKREKRKRKKSMVRWPTAWQPLLLSYHKSFPQPLPN